MTVRTMRNIDRVLGVPLCWLAGGILRIFFRHRHQPSVDEPKKILVVKFFGMGSIILSTAALSLIREKCPSASITFVSFVSNRELLERLPMIDEVRTVDPTDIWTISRDLFSVVQFLARRRFDVVFDFEFFSKLSTLFAAFSLAPRRVGFELPTRWRSWVLTHSVPLVKGRHIKDAFCSQIEMMWGTVDSHPLVPPRIEVRDLESLKRKLNLLDTPMLVVNVNAGETFLERRWPMNRFASLIAKLAIETDICFVLTGTASERSYVQEVINGTECPNRCRNLAGLLSIPELGALFLQSTLVISNDSGPLHLASVLGTPTVGLFGPESPDFYGPLGKCVTTVYKDIECSPCMNVYSAKSFRCPYHARCMKSIEVAEVHRTIEEVFELA